MAKGTRKKAASEPAKVCLHPCLRRLWASSGLPGTLVPDAKGRQLNTRLGEPRKCHGSFCFKIDVLGLGLSCQLLTSYGAGVSIILERPRL